jgi:precorrin-2 dehydrogenase / sirohydrochlorin ferrochelatase
VSGYPLLLDGSRVEALVVGGGRVAHRKAMALLESGATVRVVAPEITSPLRDAAPHWPRLELAHRDYSRAEIGNAVLVIAATNVREVNAAVAADAMASGRLVNVADFPEDGTCVTVASHTSGSLVVGVSAGGVPDAAMRIRDAVAERFGGRYATALASLTTLRGELLLAGDRDGWFAAKRELVGDDFCDTVDRDAFSARVTEWRVRHPRDGTGADAGHMDADGQGEVEGAIWGS